jgi:hypothetical protein
MVTQLFVCMLCNSCACTIIATLIFGGRVHIGFVIGSGVRRGCPLSGAIFAIIANPLLVAIFNVFGFYVLIRSFFDDLGSVLSHGIQQTPILLDFFKQFKRASNLGLNYAKFVARPLWGMFVPDLLHVLEILRDLVPDFIIKTNSKYLGIQVGPTAHSVPWKETCVAFFSGVVAVRNFGLGLPAAMRLYKIYSYSKPGYVARFYALAPDIIEVQARSLTYPSWSQSCAYNRCHV